MITEILGWSGALLLLIAYGLLSSGKLRSQNVRYQAMNIIAGVCLIINAVSNSAWPFVVLNIVWALVGVITVIRIITRKNQQNIPGNPKPDGPKTSDHAD